MGVPALRTRADRSKVLRPIGALVAIGPLDLDSSSAREPGNGNGFGLVGMCFAHGVDIGRPHQCVKPVACTNRRSLSFHHDEYTNQFSNRFPSGALFDVSGSRGRGRLGSATRRSGYFGARQGSPWTGSPGDSSSASCSCPERGCDPRGGSERTGNLAGQLRKGKRRELRLNKLEERQFDRTSRSCGKTRALRSSVHISGHCGWKTQGGIGASRRGSGRAGLAFRANRG